MLNKIEELKLENHVINGNSQNKNKILENKKDKKLIDIHTSHNLKSLENVSIGEYTYGNPKIKCYNPKDKLIIGKFCSITDDVTILIGMAHSIQCASTFPFGPFLGTKSHNVEEVNEKLVPPQKTVIGNDVWIGYVALIYPELP